MLPEYVGSQHVRAIRIFGVNRKTLMLESLNGEVWVPGEIKQSVCGHAKHHGFTKPEVKCSCGIWSCKSRKALKRTFPHLYYGERIVSAQVEQWGRVIEHRDGYRSEYARIVPGTIQFWPRPHKPSNKKLINFLRAKYS